MSNLEKIQKEYNELMEKLSQPEKVKDWDSLGEQKKQLEEIVEKKKELDNIKRRINENSEIIKNNEDEELTKIAKEENEKLLKEKEDIIYKLKILLYEKENNPSKESFSKNIIIEIRAGAGGDEASIFAGNLLEMYKRFAQEKNMDVKIMDESKTEKGGYKFVSFKMKGNSPFSLMQYEAGVHRVQRVPETEKAGRVHTSTASVAVLPEPVKGKVKINPQDIDTETCKSSGPGGQYVNKRETAIRIIHKPTGIVVTSQNERSLQQNKETALSVLEAKILQEKQRKKQEKEEKERKSQIGEAMRSEKIRTYNFMQNRVTDHRIEQSWYKLEEILEGDLNDIIKALQEAKEREITEKINIE